MGDLVDLRTYALAARKGYRRGTSATAWYELGCEREASDPAGARACYERALAGRPDLADAHNNLGRLSHDAGELADAEACYRLAICADSAVALYWFNLGVALEDAGRCAEAIGAYEQALARDARLADAHYNLARLLERAAKARARAAGCEDELLLRRAFRHLREYRSLAAG